MTIGSESSGSSVPEAEVGGLEKRTFRNVGGKGCGAGLPAERPS